MKPLLAHIYDSSRISYPCYVQPKLNGVRALYQNGCFQSRDELPFPTGLLDHLAKPLKETFSPEVILDGELYVHGWPLQRINAAVTPVRQSPTEDTIQVQYHIFDRIDFSLSFIERFKSLVDPVRPIWGPVRNVYTWPANDASCADLKYAEFVSEGYEGMMYRLGDCPYTVSKQEWRHPWSTTIARPRTRFLSDKDNRCWHLLKRKDWQDHEYECVGTVEGEGKLAGTLGALICNVPMVLAMDRKFHVGSGLTDAQRDFYWRNPPIGKLIKVKYLCLSSDGIPLNPTIHPDHIVE